jgi:predicted nucleic-acid-binding protein
MRAVDTNILVRLIVADDLAQATAAEEVVSSPFLLMPTVIMETVWVLTSNYRLTRPETADRLRRVMGLPTAELVSEDALFLALEQFEQGADFADMLHITLAAQASGTSFATFDHGIRKRSSSLPIPIETLS